MGKKYDVDRGDRFMVLDANGDLIRGVCSADEDAQVYMQIYVHTINLPLVGGKKQARCAMREGHGPFTVVPVPKVTNRAELISAYCRQFDWTLGAEIGVAKGSTSFFLLDKNPKLKMIFVDCWPTVFKRFEQRFRQGLARYPKNRYQLINKLSLEGVKEVADESLDFAFIDADHSQESCTADIKAWLPKIKPTGMLLGHDANWDGVKKAYQLCLKNVSIFHPDAVWTAWKKDQ